MNYRFFITTAICFSLSSCAYHSGSMSSSTAVTHGHFRILGYAVGTSQVNKILGLGGLNKDGLVLQAKQNLYEKYTLDTGQVFGNITIDFKTTVGFPFSKTQVFVGADVIDFYSERNATLKNTSVPDNKNEYLQPDDKTEVNGFKIGDNISAVVSGKSITGRITKFKGNWAYVNQEGDKKVWVPIQAIIK